MSSRKFGLCIAAPLVCILFTSATAEEPFTEEAVARGLTYTVDMNMDQFGSGIAFIDLDGDLDADLIVTGSATGLVAVYENDGTGNFIDRTATAAIPASTGISSVSAGDYDGDGDEDLHITRTTGMTDLLYRNDGGFSFTDVSAAAGIDADGSGFASCWGDYNADGNLDIYVAYRTGHNGNWEENRLFRNNGDGTFTDVAAAVGAQRTGDPTLVVSFFDYDNDGDADLYLGTDKGSGPDYTNHLLRNDAGTFTDVTAFSGTEANVDCMGIAYGDIDHNGYADLFVTNTPPGHVLLMANGNGTFADESAAAGVQLFQIGWGAMFFDYNNDTYEDLYVAQMNATNALFSYNGTFPMTDVSAVMAMDEPGTSFVFAAADIDLDGDLDLAVATAMAPLRLFINQEGDNRHWVRLKVMGKGSNTQAIGARAMLSNLGTTQRREVRAGMNYKSDNERLLHFGLGDAPTTNIDRIEVRWPNSTVRRVLRGYLADNTWTVYHPSQLGDPDNSGTIDPDEIQQAVQIYLANNGGEIDPGQEIFDFDGDCDVDWNDIVSMLAQYSAPGGSLSTGPGRIQP
jgi:ASPIC/UnbV protein/VCBS repeat protein